ncbi:MAG: CsgG/HfaB family protein [Nitrospirales bacterium]
MKLFVSRLSWPRPQPFGMYVSAVGIVLLTLSGTGCTSSELAPSQISTQQTPATTITFPSPLVLSVLYFEDRTRRPELAWLRKGLADMLVAELARVPSLMVVQRERLDEIIREQTLQLSGRVSDESSVRVGRLAGATVLVTGSIALSGDVLRIDARLVSVEQGILLGTAFAEGRVGEVSAVARSVVGKLLQLLPRLGDRPVQLAAGFRQGFVTAARANDLGESLSREGKLFQALEEFERAIAADPAYPAARSNYTRIVGSLSGKELLHRVEMDEPLSADRRILDRIVERLTGAGFEAEVMQLGADEARDGSLTVYLPVRLRLSPSAVSAVVEAVQALGGVVDRGDIGQTGLAVTLSSRPDLNREFVRELSDPRRLYVWLLSEEGRTVAVYSNLKDWRLSNWVRPLDGQRVTVDSEKSLLSEAVVSGLTPEQAASISALKITVDRVRRERATVHLEVSDLEEMMRGNRPELLLEGTEAGEGTHVGWRHARPRVEPSGEELFPGLRSLRAIVARDWNPPVTERPWAPGDLPGNERTAVVTMELQPDGFRVREAPRLVRLSGDREYDLAALAAMKSAMQQWVVEGAGGQRSQAQGSAHSLDSAGSPFIKVRAHFRLRKDMPALNLIGPAGGVQPLAPASLLFSGRQ